MIATYTFLPKDETLESDGLVNINIFHFKTAIDTDEAFGLRTAAVKSGTDLVHEEPKESRAINDYREVIALDNVAGLTGSFRMFEYVPETWTAYFLVTVESQFKSDSLLARPSGEPWWMGYSVEVSNRGCLILKAEVIKETITDGPAKGIWKGATMLDFLTRKDGTHGVMLSLYCPNLDSASATYHQLVGAQPDSDEDED
ncbi:hypothetical protein ABVK25_000220 [Lepraria finkii]|uniref:Uncharacterized protein n=1 Tax=Lepraria finkii TaxID=1340010 RepID=A0ABR4BRG8_9LECA